MVLRSRYFPHGRRWVLRNLTKKEYVYAHAFTSDSGRGGGIDRPHARHEWGFSLGTLIVVRTCWSDQEDSSMEGLDVQGKWAGDRFDIVVEETLMKDIARGEMWLDVSYREWEMMVMLYKKHGLETYKGKRFGRLVV